MLQRSVTCLSCLYDEVFNDSDFTGIIVCYVYTHTTARGCAPEILLIVVGCLREVNKLTVITVVWVCYCNMMIESIQIICTT